VLIDCYGVTAEHNSAAELVFNDDITGMSASGFLGR
jgi:hypothetical protein